MNRLRTSFLGFCALVALACFTNTGTAVASEETELLQVTWCSVNEDHCKNAFVPAFIHFDLVAGTKATIKTSLGTIECSESHMGVKEGKTEAEAIQAEIATVSLTGCVMGGTACTATPEFGGSWILALLNSLGQYHLIIEPIPNVSFTCNGLECHYEIENLLYAIEKLATDSDAVGNNQVFHRKSGLLCPETATFNAKYLLKCLKPLNTVVPCWPAMLKAGF